MTHYNVTHTCHHTDTYTLFGRLVDRQKKLELMKKHICNDCLAKRKEQFITKMRLPNN